MFLAFRPKKNKSVPFVIFVFFLLTFLISRAIVYFLPGFHLLDSSINGHVHHFVYGIILLSIVGYISLVINLNNRNRLRFASLYGIALGMVYDEFAMWLELEDIYHDRRSYDVIMLIALLLINLIYFSDFWQKWGRKLDKLLKILLLSAPRGIYKVIIQLLGN